MYSVISNVIRSLSMEHDPKAFLYDISQSCNDILDFTKQMTVDEYAKDPLIKAAVERKFLVIGEALVRLRDEFPEILKSISDHSKIIGFRNVLVHGYDVIDDITVWSAVSEGIPKLLSEVQLIIDK